MKFFNFLGAMCFMSFAAHSQPCQTPYAPTVPLSSVPTESGDGIQLSWIQIPQSKGCQIQLQETDGTYYFLQTLGIGISEFIIPDSILLPNKEYSWNVRCGCQFNPQIVGPWSTTLSFNSGSVGSLEGYPPIARMEAQPIAPVAGTTVTFGSRSPYDPIEWHWDFGDGATSDEMNPQHVYTDTGTYTVSVTITNAFGTDTKIREDYIEVYEPNCPESVMDIHGREYAVVQMGDQCWMAENLAVTKFSNGDEIANLPDLSDWLTGTDPAYAFYDNDSTNGEIYGILYNGYTVTDERNLCPTGWHVSTESDWQTMESVMGMTEFELDLQTVRGNLTKLGGQLKSMDLWGPFNRGATDSYGFSVLPAGYRYNVLFDFTGLAGTARIAVPNDLFLSIPLFSRDFSFLSWGIEKSVPLMSQGLSVRCVMD
jgi:uncharacterized protein (TIGR02145 family)